MISDSEMTSAGRCSTAETRSSWTRRQRKTLRGKNTFYRGHPTNDVIVVSMIQNLRGSIPAGDTSRLRERSPRLVNAALVDPKT